MYGTLHSVKKNKCYEKLDVCKIILSHFSVTSRCVYSLTRVDLDCDYLHTLYILLYYNNTYWKYGMCVIHSYYQQLLLVKKSMWSVLFCLLVVLSCHLANRLVSKGWHQSGVSISLKPVIFTESHYFHVYVVVAMYTFVIVTMRLCGQRNRSPKISK